MTELITLTPQEVKTGMDAGEIILIDVREVHEFNEAHIEGAHNHPLSSFDPDTLPVPLEGQYLVMQCARGVRSMRAVEACQIAGADIHTHMGGGIMAWYEDGLPLVR